jgi:hypothetical protein
VEVSPFLNLPQNVLANQQQRLVNTTVPVKFYPSTSVLDDLSWAGVALFIATGKEQFLGDAQVRVHVSRALYVHVSLALRDKVMSVLCQRFSFEQPKPPPSEFPSGVFVRVSPLKDSPAIPQKTFPALNLGSTLPSALHLSRASLPVLSARASSSSPARTLKLIACSSPWARLSSPLLDRSSPRLS